MCIPLLYRRLSEFGCKQGCTEHNTSQLELEFLRNELKQRDLELAKKDEEIARIMKEREAERTGRTKAERVPSAKI